MISRARCDHCGRFALQRAQNRLGRALREGLLLLPAVAVGVYVLRHGKLSDGRELGRAMPSLCGAAVGCSAGHGSTLSSAITCVPSNTPYVRRSLHSPSLQDPFRASGKSAFCRERMPFSPGLSDYQECECCFLSLMLGYSTFLRVSAFWCPGSLSFPLSLLRRAATSSLFLLLPASATLRFPPAAMYHDAIVQALADLAAVAPPAGRRAAAAAAAATAAAAASAAGVATAPEAPVPTPPALSGTPAVAALTGGGVEAQPPAPALARASSSRKISLEEHRMVSACVRSGRECARASL